MVILEQSVCCACVHCANNQSLELIDFFAQSDIQPVIFDVFHELSSSSKLHVDNAQTKKKNAVGMTGGSTHFSPCFLS